MLTLGYCGDDCVVDNAESLYRSVRAERWVFLNWAGFIKFSITFRGLHLLNRPRLLFHPT
jgi:hypothetical protein